MGSVVNVKLYEFARKEMKFSEEKATEFVQTIHEVIKQDMKGEGNSELATKSFVKEEVLATRVFVKEEIIATRVFVKEEILATRVFVKEEILATRVFVKEEIHRIELSLTKAIFWSGLIQFLAIVGSVIAIINFALHK